jgi:hypothetical protein
MSTDRKERFARGLSTWLRTYGIADASLWIDMQVAVGLMSRSEAREFTTWLGAGDA